MKIHPGYIGIDISKHHLDVFDSALERGWRLANAVSAIEDLLASWSGRPVFVLFEATGPYDRCLRGLLERGGIAFARVNPVRARAFARAVGCLAKTDAIDARLLASMARSLAPAPQAATCRQRDKLALLHRRRDQLVACRKQERTRLDGCDDVDVQADLTAHLAELDARISRLEAIIHELLHSVPDLDRAQHLLRSIPGIGPVTAATLIALLPELGSRPPKSIAALAGLAPFNQESGLWRGQRRIKGGRRRVRQALYMAAVAATHTRQRFAAIYQAMLAAGKPPKLAIIAIARKILITANAILRDDVPFRA